MKEKIKIEITKKYTTDLDTVITRDNVLYLCENMALCALKRMIGYRGDYELRLSGQVKSHFHYVCPYYFSPCILKNNM